MSDKAKSGSKKGKRIPKTVAGVKVPKELRRAGEKLLDEVQRPETQAKIAGVLTMAAGAVAAAAAKKRAAAATPSQQEKDAPSQPGQGGTTRGPDSQVVADAIGQAAEQMMSRFFGRRA